MLFLLNSSWRCKVWVNYLALLVVLAPDCQYDLLRLGTNLKLRSSYHRLDHIWKLISIQNCRIHSFAERVTSPWFCFYPASDSSPVAASRLNKNCRVTAWVSQRTCPTSFDFQTSVPMRVKTKLERGPDFWPKDPVLACIHKADAASLLPTTIPVSITTSLRFIA